MSQVAKILAVKVTGSVFLGVRVGEDAFSSNPAEVMQWLTDGWRTRFNQHRSKRHTYAYGFFDQVGADEQGRVLVPLGSQVTDVSDKEARVLFSHLAALPMQVIQSAERYEWKSWFAAAKRRETLRAQGKKPGRMPRFRSKKRDDEVFACWFNGGKNATVARTGKRSGILTIRGQNPSGKYGHTRAGRQPLRWSVQIRFRWTQPVAEYTSVMVNVTTGQVAFTSPVPPRPHNPNGEIVGVDVGAVHTATTSNGDHYAVPDFTDQYAQLRKLDRKLAKARTIAEKEGRDWRSSKRYRKLRQHKQQLEQSIVNAREDWAHKTANALVDTADVLVFEDLNIQSMTAHGGTRKKGLNRAMTRACIGRLREMVEYKAKGAGVEVINVPAPYTSQRCNECGHIDKENRKSQAGFSCLKCGHTTNADINAARNIRDLALGAWTAAPASRTAGSVGAEEDRQPARVPRKRPASVTNRKPTATRPTRAW